MSRTTILPGARRARLAAGLAALAVTTAGLAGGLTSPAGAREAAPPAPRTVADGLLSPLSLAVAPDRTVWFSQNFAGVLMRKEPGAKAAPYFTAKAGGAEVGAVSVGKDGVRFAVTGPTGNTRLMGIGRAGKVRSLANLSKHEADKNPDAGTTYGFRDLDEECASQFPEDFPASYTGIVESHPYASYLRNNGSTYVADAAGNDILLVNKAGKVRTIAVLPPQPLLVDEAAAEANGMPACAAGHVYWFEPVPTDVERGRDGKLYVTLLPGGPEDPSLGARGSVYRVNPGNHSAQKVVGGLQNPTGLAVARNGRILVAELFGGRISWVARNGHTAHTYLETPLPGDVEVVDGRTWFTGNVLPGEEEPPAGTVNVIR